MAQTKKTEVREGILRSAFALFARHGYSGTTLADIARDAGVATASIYVYFRSKMEVLLEVYRPWLTVRLERLERETARRPEPRARLRAILLALWRDIPAERNGFANNLMQAMSTAQSGEGYSRDLLRWSEGRLTRMIRDCLPPARRVLATDDALAHLVFMAFDGFVIGRRFNGPVPRVEAVVDLVCDLLLGPGAGARRPGSLASRARALPASRRPPRRAGRGRRGAR